MNAECTQTNGSYRCMCGYGYEGDGFNCTGELFVIEMYGTSYFSIMTDLKR